MKKIIFTIFIVSLLTGCNTLKDLSNIRKPDVRFSNVSIQDFSFSDVTLLFDFDVTNPNSFGVSADQYEYEFFINGSEFVSGIQKENIRIGDNSTSTIQVPVSLTFSEVYDTFRSFIRQDSMAYELSTKVQFDIAGLGKQSVPVHAEGVLPIPKLPRVELSSFDVEKLSFSGAEMVASLRIENPNSFGITFANAAYNLNVNEKEWLNTSLGRDLSLQSSDSQTIDIPINLNSSQMGSVLVDMLQGKKEFDYHLTGTADVSADIRGFSGVQTIPFDLRGTYRMD